MNENDLVGKVIVITGATSGLGQGAAIAFARRGAHVVAVGRDPARAADTRAKDPAHIEVVVGDVSTKKGAQAVAAAVLAKHPRVDVLLNNAGGTFNSKLTTEDGLEATVALNTVAPQWLTTALHPALAAARGRVVNVATGFLDRFPVVVDELNAPKSFSGFTQYGRAKLASVMLTVENAGKDNVVTHVAVHPGIIMGTRFSGGQPAVMQAIFGPLMRGIGLACTLDEGVARLAAACFDDVKSGSYMQKGQVTPLPKQANDVAVRAAVRASLAAWA